MIIHEIFREKDLIKVLEKIRDLGYETEYFKCKEGDKGSFYGARLQLKGKPYAYINSYPAVDGGVAYIVMQKKGSKCAKKLITKNYKNIEN